MVAKKKLGKSIAIIGPDGAGKSTISIELAERYRDCENEVKHFYGSKKEDQYLMITKFSYKLYEFMKFDKNTKLKLSSKVATIYLLLFHYPIELIDNILAGLSVKRETKYKIVIYDRHPLDRLLPLTKSYLQYLNKKKLFSKIIILLQKFYAKQYLYHGPYADFTIILLPGAQTIFERRAEFYKNKKRAEIASNVYIELSKLIKDKTRVVIINEIVTAKELMEIIEGGIE